MSSAQAAASAAFSGTKAPAAPQSHKRKPSFRIKTDPGFSSSKSHTPGGSVAPETPKPRSQPPIEAPTPVKPSRRDSKSGSGSSTKNTPSSAAISGARASSGARYSGANTPASVATRAARNSRGSRSSRGSKSPLGTAEEAYGSSPANIDYFSLPRAASAASHDVHSETPKSVRSPSTKPHDMLEQVRSSINSKSKSGTSKEAARKSQLALDKFRQSVDSRMVLSPAVSFNDSSREDISRDSGSKRSSRQSSAGELYQNAGCNRSQSSVGSVVSDIHSDEPTALLTPNFKFSYCDSVSSDSSKRRPPSPHDAPSPIPIPLSSQGVDRGLAASAPEPFTKASLSPVILTPASVASVYSATSVDPLSDADEIPVKPGRKKPPLFIDTDSIRNTSGSDLESAGPGLESSDIDTDDSENIKFPLFPGISSEKHHHHRIGLFSKKKSKRDKGVVYDPESPPADENELSLAPAHSRNTNQQGKAVQPVKLRTTMRKEDKKKERKTAFDEDKPWKNHGSLDVISDAQRKRYEGLWVSNKGLYINHVATKLVGVDIDREEESALSKTVREYSEHEISERAAKLSAKLNLDFDSTDIREVHSLESASTSNLIHGSVVKKLWSRSNLPRETLQEIWELVDCRKDGTLNKAEFIVGMWLVDQCLYGRKLPKVVSKSVWSSLGGLGVNVVIKKKRR